MILMSLAIVAVGFISNAQRADNRGKFVFGLKVGANNSNVYDSQGEEFEARPKIGFATGVFLAIPIFKAIGAQPEVLFSQKGFRATGRILGGPYEFSRTTSYIDVPLFFALKPAEFLTLLAGPQFSYLLHQRDEFKNVTSSIAQEKEFENDNVRKNTVGFAMGLDINIRHIVLGARAAWDVMDNNGNGTSTTPRYKNVWLQGTLGYRFY